MNMQADILKYLGIAHEVGKSLLKERISEVARSVSAVNHMRSVDVARLLDMAYMCVHTPADNHVTDYLQKLFVKKTENKIISPKHNIISTDTVYMSIDSLDSKRDTVKLYYETKVSNYNILPSSERIELFASRINR